MPKKSAKEPGIGSRVRAARERRGWTREALAYHSGLSWSAIAQVETGRRTNVRPATLSALAEALGVTIDYLVHGSTPHPPMLRHGALLYATDEGFAEVAAAFLSEGLERSEPALAVTTRANIALVRDRLGARAKEVEFVDSRRRLTTPGAVVESFRTFLQDGLDRGAPWVRILGEPTWAGRSKSEIRLWARHESLLNLVFAASPLSFLCPYDERSVDPAIVREARATHPETIDAEGPSTSPDYADPGEFLLGS